MSGMWAAPPSAVKLLSLLFVTAVGYASSGAVPVPPAPASAAPPQHTAQTAPATTAWIDPGASSPVPVREAVAVLSPTKGSSVHGVVRFREDGGTLAVTASVAGLPAGVHAFHVHVYGDCSSPDAESAGPHFHFTGSSFDKQVRIITGDLGELRPDDKGVAEQRASVRATLQGPYSILGRAVIVHELGNNPKSPPAGAAGKRLACGAIGIAGPAPATPAAAPRP